MVRERQGGGEEKQANSIASMFVLDIANEDANNLNTVPV
jgi:hypothetical protein